MSSPPTIQKEGASDFEFPAQNAVETAGKKLLAPVQFIGFWAAVTLPLGYLPFLYGGSITDSADVLALLFVLNLVAMVVGHGYKRD
ncbi:hypothetical protein [Haladaptatus sp. DYF46]|uniref:hypothetical protein n=1 Tax=Haladaptatus sp. DYF46 TaxID=2886041 RepID=UPI001E5A4E86|nr:hypothetical protein [Haladaptatus sp. DYF46]